MIVAVASGKGGTGKTTVAVGLALAAADRESVTLLDCDAEAPDAALFFDFEVEEQRDAGVLVPRVDRERCAGCGICAEVCQFGALAAVGGPPLVFPALCHGCGSCSQVCPEHALSEHLERTGALRAGRAGPLRFAEARLDVGQAMATPVIRQLKAWRGGGGRLCVVDCPPGTACPAIEAVRGADVALLVTEPTPFGLHDLELAVEVFHGALGVPVAVVVNRAGLGDDGVERFCEREAIPVLLRIPFERRIAAALADGVPLVEALPEYRSLFRDVLVALRAEAVA